LSTLIGPTCNISKIGNIGMLYRNVFAFWRVKVRPLFYLC